MTLADGVLLFMVAGSLAYFASRFDPDELVRDQVTQPVGVHHLVAGIVFALLALACLAYGVGQFASPGTTVVESGRFRGAEVHHWVHGVLGVFGAALIGYPAWGLIDAWRHRDPL